MPPYTQKNFKIGVRALAKSAKYFYSLNIKGGYAGIHDLDSGKVYGEGFRDSSDPNEIWVQPPGTPYVGQCYLRAYHITNKKQYLKAAISVGKILVWGQLPVGGWRFKLDTTNFDVNNPHEPNPSPNSHYGVFDDHTTTANISFLMNLHQEIKESWLYTAIDKGLEFVMKAQFANGAWPQRFPLRGGYRDFYTYNDGVINNCIALMYKAHRLYDNSQYLRSAVQGSDFVLASQLASPQAGWGEQYNHDMQPDWARPFEPPCVCPAVTVHCIGSLLHAYLYTKNKKYLQTIPEAIAWLKAAVFDEKKWARHYEIGTNKPFYVPRSGGAKYYDYNKLIEKDRNSFDYHRRAAYEGIEQFFNEISELGATNYIAKNPNILAELEPCQYKKYVPSFGMKEKMRPKLPKLTKNAIKSLDSEGRWIGTAGLAKKMRKKQNVVLCHIFVRNFNTICAYLEEFQRLQNSNNELPSDYV
ncbi:MAG: pectate lyase [Chitinophagales bacterium]